MENFKKVSDIIFGTTRARRVLSATVVLAIVMTIPFCYDQEAYLFSIIGGSVGAAGALIVILGIFMTPAAERNASQDLLFWRAVCDLGLGIRFLSYHYWNQYICNADQCYIVEPNTNHYNTYEDQCGLPSAVLEFCEIASEGWFICLAVDLAITISNPFSSFKDRVSKYHVFSWCFGGVMSLVLGLSHDLHGFWYVTPEIDNNAFCWIKSHRSDSDKFVINFRPWLMFYIPLLFVYMYAVVALYIAYKRLQTGISKTFQHRVKVLILNSINITVYMLYWTLVLVLYALVNDVSVSSDSESPLYKLLLFSISAKGFADLFVWIMIVDTNNIMSEAKLSHGSSAGGSLDLNQALRMEVLYYATTGIRKSVQRGPTIKKGQDKAVISMNQKSSASSGTSLFTPKVFLLIMFGFKKEVAQLIEFASHNESKGAKRQKSLKQHEENEHFNPRASQRETVVSNSHEVSQSNPLHKSSTLDEELGEGIPLSKINQPDLSVIDADPDMGAVRESEVSVSDYDYDENQESNSSGFRIGETIRHFLFGNAGSTNDDDNNRVLFTEFAPHEFRKVRTCFDVSEQMYEDSFSTTIKERLTEGGASGAFFFFSKGEKFIAKSCTDEEMNLLVENANTYSTYLEENPNSFITKIYGAYKLQIYGTDLYFFVMNNLLLTKDNEALNEKYDLKGSWVARNSTPPQQGQRVTCMFCNQKFIYERKSNKAKQSTSSRADCSGASNSLENVDEVEIDRCPVTVHGYHEPNVIMKDNDLKYKIRLPPSTALPLYMQLRKDAQLLCSMGIMDYSLLVGVHNREYGVVDVLEGEEGNIIADNSSKPAKRGLIKRSSVAVRSPTQDKDSLSSGDGDSSAFAAAQHALKSGISSETSAFADSSFEMDGVIGKRLQVSRVVGPEAYYIGIIDFLQEWNLKKKLERAVKINFKGADPDGLSAIPPDIYRDRFIRRMEELLDVDEADLALVRANIDHKSIRGTASSNGIAGNVEV